MSHREALLWAALKVGGFAGSALGFGVAALIFGPERPDRSFVLRIAGMVLALCAAAVGMYIYVSLSGGVMGSEERERYLERRREARRGR